MTLRPSLLVLGIALGVAGTEVAARAQAPARAVRFRFVPTTRAQIAIWIESADGSRFATVRLTDAVCIRGIGNRPGASQMNSGYRWPIGRREGVLPVWAHRRAAAPGASRFARVIFQNRPEGWASRMVEDSTPDAYFCLSFTVQTTRRDGLDAVSCASVFNGDKGRFITLGDLSAGYSEPFEEAGAGTTRILDGTSLYPPRSDVQRCVTVGCLDSADVDMFGGEARRVLPDLDAISMATPPGDLPVEVSFPIPAAWPDGDYVAYLEINSEGDYNSSYNDTVYPTPTRPTAAWDSWAISWGYPFRGQPSVVFRLAFRVGPTATVATRDAFGFGSLSGHGPQGGDIRPIDATISDNPSSAPGSGVDRLRVTPEGYRLRVEFPVVAVDAGMNPDARDGAMPDAPPADGGATPTADAAADSAGPTDPLCVPGRTVSCACIGGGEGAQTCRGDGQGYEACQCLPLTKSDGCGCDLGARPAQSWLFAVIVLLTVRSASRRRAAARRPAARK